MSENNAEFCQKFYFPSSPAIFPKGFFPIKIHQKSVILTKPPKSSTGLLKLNFL